MKKTKYFLYLLTFAFLGLNICNVIAANSKPWVICTGLPGCSNWNDDTPVFNFMSKLISEWIKYVAVIAVISIMISWIFYIISTWEEEKTKKAKLWIIWSLVWVVISISAWSVINLLNLFKIN
jgi:hypothetical protein